MRCFLALPVTGAVVDMLLSAQDQVPFGRAVPEDDFHLTLAFLGEQAPFALALLDEALNDLIVPDLSLNLEAWALMGGRTPSLLAATVQSDPRLTALRNKIRNACRHAGIEFARERFRPHVTILRFPRSNRDGTRIASAVSALPKPSGGFGANRVHLTRSTLTEDGPIYDTLATYPEDAS